MCVSSTQDLMVGMIDASDDALLSNFAQLLKHVYRPALESLLFFAEDGPEKVRVYEEVLMSMHSLCSSLKGICQLRTYVKTCDNITAYGLQCRRTS